VTGSTIIFAYVTEGYLFEKAAISI